MVTATSNPSHEEEDSYMLELDSNTSSNTQIASSPPTYKIRNRRAGNNGCHQIYDINNNINAADNRSETATTIVHIDKAVSGGCSVFTNALLVDQDLFQNSKQAYQNQQRNFNENVLMVNNEDQYQMNKDF